MGARIMNATTETTNAGSPSGFRATLAAMALLMTATLHAGQTARAQGPGRAISLVGTWGARVQFGGDPAYLCLYTFSTDGTVREDAFTLEGRPLGSGQGRAMLASDGRMRIVWPSGTVETAMIRAVSDRRIDYRITAHSGDPRQVGAVIRFLRMSPPAGNDHPGDEDPDPAPQPPAPRDRGDDADDGDFLTVEEIRVAIGGVEASLRVAREALASASHYTDKIYWSNQVTGCELRISDLKDLLIKAAGGQRIPRGALGRLRGTGGSPTSPHRPGGGPTPGTASGAYTPPAGAPASLYDVQGYREWERHKAEQWAKSFGNSFSSP
jgi:hypothetical protein